MSMIDNQHLVQALFPDRSYHPFSVGIGIGGTIGCADYINAFGAKNGIKGVTEFLVVIPNEKPNGRIAILECPQHLTCLLG